MSDEVDLGRVTRDYRCSKCGGEVSEVKVDLVDGKVVMAATCANGHKLDASWKVGEPVPELPVKTEWSTERMP